MLSHNVSVQLISWINVQSAFSVGGAKTSRLSSCCATKLYCSYFVYTNIGFCDKRLNIKFRVLLQKLFAITIQMPFHFHLNNVWESFWRKLINLHYVHHFVSIIWFQKWFPMKELSKFNVLQVYKICYCISIFKQNNGEQCSWTNYRYLLEH